MVRHLGVFSMGLALCALAACVSPEAHLELKAANDDLQRQLADLERYHKELEDENRRLRVEVERLGMNAADADFVREQKEELARLINEFQQGGARAIPGIEVIRTGEGVAFRVQGEVLFSSGQAEITTEGKQALSSLVPVLRERKKDIRIDGHTDTDPIRRSLWKTNLRLSAERAMAVQAFLSGQGFDPVHMSIAAYGEYKPAVAGSTAEAKRSNRRVEILMLDK